MVTNLPDVEKEQVQERKSRRSVKSVLLDPRTWKVAVSVLDFGLKFVKLIAKVWDILG